MSAEKIRTLGLLGLAALVVAGTTLACLLGSADEGFTVGIIGWFALIIIAGMVD